VVLPEYRGKGLAIRMIAALEDGLSENVRRGEFEFADSAIFTAKLAGVFGHEVIRIGARFERVLYNLVTASLSSLFGNDTLLAPAPF
jgi:hypothetical protein